MYIEHKLIPTDSHKSFYGKAKVIVNDNGWYLQSYDTIVCMIDNKGEFSRLWQGYSVTTMRHINAFRELMGMDPINKAAWCKL